MQPPPLKPALSLGGVHISRGVRLRIPVGGLVIHTGTGDDPRMEVTAVELQLDTCVHWLEIALEHLAAAKLAHETMLTTPANSPNFGSLLDREFKASVQAAVAAATFFEALYATAVERDPRKPPHTKDRPTRYKVVTEQLHRSFGLKKQGTANLRSVLKEVYRFRDQAVHPSAAFTQPMLHPQLQVGVEHRFVMFSFSSTKQLVRAALAFSKILPSCDLTRQPKEIQDLGTYLLEVCLPLHITWEQHYGQLIDVPANAAYRHSTGTR
jgi:hypothetical protein